MTALQLKNPDLFSEWWESFGKDVAIKFISMRFKRFPNADIDDLLQTVAMRLWRTINRKDLDSKPTTIMFLDVHSVCSAFKMSKSRKQKFWQTNFESADEPDEIIEPEELPDLKELHLTVQERQVLDGILNDQTQMKIAEEMGITKQRCSQLYWQIINRIRQHIGVKYAKVPDEDANASGDV